MNPCKIVLSSVLVLALARLSVEAQEARRGARLPKGVTVERDVAYGKGGGVTLLLDLYRPEDPPGGKLPAVIWIHGGGWRGGDKAQHPFPGMLAARGYVAASINYRLSGVATFPAAIEDCKCAVRWLRANAETYGVDPERIGVWGASAGGHLSLLVATADASAGLEGKGGHQGVSSRVQAVCSYFGPAEFTALIAGGEGGSGRNAVTQFLGGSPDEVPDRYKLGSPVTHASSDDPPALLVHGEEDTTVPISQSERMKAALEKVDVQVTLIRVKNAGHGFQRSRNADPPNEEIERTVVEFFDRHLKAPEGAAAGR